MLRRQEIYYNSKSCIMIFKRFESQKVSDRMVTNIAFSNLALKKENNAYYIVKSRYDVPDAFESFKKEFNLLDDEVSLVDDDDESFIFGERQTHFLVNKDVDMLLKLKYGL